MNLRTKLALSLLIAALPARTIDLTRAAKLAARLREWSEKLERVAQAHSGPVDARDVLSEVLDAVS